MKNIWGLYSLFTSSIFIIAVVFSFYLFIVKKHGLKNALQLSGEKVNEFSPTIKFLLLIVVALIFIGFWMPFLLTREAIFKEFDFTGTGAIGDTFGGILNPFVALAAVIVTGLAFYVQYQANQQARDHFYKGLEEQKEQFKFQIRTDNQNLAEQRDTELKTKDIDRFETHFFELLRLHKENLGELVIELQQKTATSGSAINGRRAFRLMNFELEKTYGVIDEVHRQVITKPNRKFEMKLFKLAYFIFFEGYFSFMKFSSYEIATKFGLDKSFIDCLGPVLKDIRKRYKNSPHTPVPLFVAGIKIRDIHFNMLPFVGQSPRRGHYYRHLFFMAKFITSKDNELYSYNYKRNFIRILRIQLCSDEQLMLFYNWLSDYGNRWEEKNIKRRSLRSGNFFFTDYRMIHNINANDLIIGVDLLKIFNNRRYRGFLFEQGSRSEDTLFEVNGIESILTDDLNSEYQNNR